MTELQKRLFSMQDIKYKEFHCQLMPTIDSDTVIGVRSPRLRKLASEIRNDSKTDAFLHSLPHKYYEENNLHAFIVSGFRDYGKALEYTENFLPYIDNWATCDAFAPKVFGKKREDFLPVVKKWIVSDKPYTVRYGIGMLMRFYLDDEYFSEDLLALAADIKSDEYYVNMMVAWYFATALAKQYDSAIRFINDKRLPVWTHNKAIQKAIESRRISPETKEYLRTQKIRGTR